MGLSIFGQTWEKNGLLAEPYFWNIAILKSVDMIIRDSIIIYETLNDKTQQNSIHSTIITNNVRPQQYNIHISIVLYGISFKMFE